MPGRLKASLFGFQRSAVAHSGSRAGERRFEPTLQSVLVLALIVLIHTFLSMAFEVEVDGHWPWQRAVSNRSPTWFSATFHRLAGVAPFSSDFAF
jgi:hypothetical protein